MIATWLALALDLALVIIVVELGVLALVARRARAWALAALPTILAGLFLLAALRLAVADASPMLILAALAAGGMAHAADLWLRWRSGTPG